MAGQSWAPMLSIGFVIFSLILVTMINAFASDEYASVIGTASANTYGLANQSSSSALTSWSDLDFISKIGFTINFLPAWLSFIFVSFEAFMVIIIVMAWVRGV